jgi:4-amino-4-deoxychorismate lyase
VEPTTVLVDGVPAATVSVLDRGLAFGDGVFRTFAVRAGRPLNWQWHLRRLAADCALLRLEAPGEAVVREDLARVATGDATVKIIVTRGVATRGYAMVPARPTRITVAFPPVVHPPEAARDGVRVRRCALVLSEQPRLAGAKTLNRLENVLARSEWHEPEIAEGLLGDARGHVIEGISCNLFVVRDGTAATPRLDRCGVVGAQRERVREALAAQGTAVVERDIPWLELEAADEVFLTNSLIGAWPVRALGGRAWAVGPVTRRVQALIAESDARA